MSVPASVLKVYFCNDCHHSQLRAEFCQFCRSRMRPLTYINASTDG